MKRFSRNFLFCVLFTSFLVGCDKIPLLSKYFPSLQKPSAQTTPAAPAPSSPAPRESTGPVLARVGNWTMTLDEFNEKINALKTVFPDLDVADKQMKKDILEELVRQELLVQDAESRGIANEKEIREAVENSRRTILVQEVAGRMTKDISVTDAEARDFYEKNKDALAEPAQWHIREIVVPTQTEANDILVQILQGADFAKLAIDRSKSASASKGGDLGAIDIFDFPEMESAVKALSIGGVSSVFKGPQGFYIVKLEEKTGGVPKAFSEINDDIKQALTLQKQQQVIMDYLNTLEQKITVEKHDELL